MGNNACEASEDNCCTGDESVSIHRNRLSSQFKQKSSPHLKHTKISDDYIILHPAIGKGSFGCVYKALNRTTGLTRAVKRDHPNIIRIHDIYVEEVFLYIVTQYCSGGELFERIVDKQTITQNEARIYMKQLLSAIVNCHSNNIMHRDLKPENIMFLTKQSYDLKIIDFGAGTCYRDDKSQTLKIGSIYYIAPEVIKKQYNEKCDVWSLGVILYIMLSGSPPFNGKNDQIIYSKILKGSITFPENKWNKVSPQARELIVRMLEFHPESRISARQALLSSWFSSSSREGNKNLYIVNEMQAMKQFSKINKFQSAVITFISYNLVEAKSLSKLQNKFKQIDLNNDGKISENQFKRCFLENMPPISEEELQVIFKKLDQNGSGFIDYTGIFLFTLEFISSAFHKNYEENNLLLEKAFKLIDKDRDGYLDADELELSFGYIDPEISEQMFKQADLNGDRKISMEQFKYVMKNISLKSKTEKQATKATKNEQIFFIQKKNKK